MLMDSVGKIAFCCDLMLCLMPQTCIDPDDVTSIECTALHVFLGACPSPFKKLHENCSICVGFSEPAAMALNVS